MVEYWVIPIELVPQLEALQPQTLEPHHNFCCASSPNGEKAIVCADWTEDSLAILTKNGIRLGPRLEDGNASLEVYEYLESDEWLLN